MATMMGKCEYCGMEIGVIAKTQAEANKMASEKCDCHGGRIAEKKRCMSERLQELAGKECGKLGFQPVEDEVFAAIERIAHMVIDGRIQSAVFKVSGTVISIKGGEKTKILRKYTYEQKEEIE